VGRRRCSWSRSRLFKPRRAWGSQFGYHLVLLFKTVEVVVAKVRYMGWRVETIWTADYPQRVLYARQPGVKKMKARVLGAAAGGDDKACHLAAVETILMGQFPQIVAHLITTRLEDGTARTPGTVLVKTMGSSWVLVFKEPDQALQLQVMAQTADDAFELAEVLLGGDKAPWEPDPWQRSRNTKNKK